MTITTEQKQEIAKYKTDLDKRAAPIASQLFDTCTGNFVNTGWVFHKMLDQVMAEASRRGMPEEPVGIGMMLDWLITKYGRDRIALEIKDWPEQEIDQVPAGNA